MYGMCSYALYHSWLPQVNWTKVSTILATLSIKFPHFVGFTIDDFYCMMEDPNVPPGTLPPGTPPPLAASTFASIRAVTKRIAPQFMFMPTVGRQTPVLESPRSLCLCPR